MKKKERRKKFGLQYLEKKKENTIVEGKNTLQREAWEISIMQRT